jgi:hypothetical protein
LDFLQRRNFDSSFLQVGEESPDSLQIVEILRVSDCYQGLECHWAFLILSNNKIYHGRQLVKSHAAEVKFEWIPEAQTVSNLIQSLGLPPSRNFLHGRIALPLKAKTLSREHSPKWNHLGVDRYLKQPTPWILSINILLERPVVSIS